MSNAEQLIKLLDYNLVNEKFDLAKKLLEDEEKYSEIILTHYSDVIQEVVLKYLTTEHYHSKPKLYEACEYILILFAKKCHQQGILFEFLEILETVKVDDDVFRSVLKALQIILLNQSESKSRSLEYTLNSIEDYILELPLPKLFEKKYLEEEEEKLLENDEKVRRILMNYMTLNLFYEPILKQIVESSTDTDSIYRSTKYNRRNVLFCFILRLLGKPLSHLVLSFDATDNERTKTYSREVAENLVAALCKLHVNVFDLLNYIEIRCRWPAKDKIDDDLANIFLHPEKLPILQVGILFYLIIGEKIDCGTPKVYSQKYVFSSCLYLVHELLSSHESIIPKGLKLCRETLLNIDDPLESSELESDIYIDFCNSLIKTIIYSPSKSNRQKGLELLKQFILKFDTAGRYLLIKNVMKTSTHKGLIGYLTTLYKDIIFEKIDEKEMSKYLSGFNLKQLVFGHICKLENGVQCDLTDSSDQITAALNFIMGLYVRDKDNKTGIRDFIGNLQSGYLKDLRAAIDFSRAHFKAEYERVKSDTNEQQSASNNMNVDILNDNTALDDLTKEKKLEMLKSALMMFDLMEFQLARVTELTEKSFSK